MGGTRWTRRRKKIPRRRARPGARDLACVARRALPGACGPAGAARCARPGAHGPARTARRARGPAMCACGRSNAGAQLALMCRFAQSRGLG